MLDRTVILPHVIAARAAKTPDQEFVYDLTAGKTFTCAGLHREILRWAAAYQRAGVGEGDHVVTMLPGDSTATQAWLGLSWLKAIEVPLNTAYKGPMLQYIVDNSDAAVAVVSQRFVDRFVDIAADLPQLRRIIVPDAAGDLPALPFEVVRGEDFFAGVEPAVGLSGPEFWDMACIIYTSGTTGPSKGVLVPWGQFYMHATFGGVEAETWQVDDPAYYVLAPQFHVGGKTGVYIAALYDARLVLREQFSLTEFWNDVRKYHITFAGLLGPMPSFLLSLPPQPDEDKTPLKYCSSAPLLPSITQFAERFGVKVNTGYGMTEVGAPLAHGYNLPNLQSCGKARTDVGGIELRVADEHDFAVPPNVVGELLVRTRDPWFLNVGYYKMPEATAAAWRNGWFHTGDAFRYDEDGNYYFVDRIKDAIRRRGENISSFEVEAYVMRHPAVAEVAAVAVPSEHSEDEVKVIVVPKPGEEFTPEGLIRFLIPIMPRFMIPRYVQVAEALPKTPTLRVKKAELRGGAAGEEVWDREAAGIEIPKK